MLKIIQLANHFGLSCINGSQQSLSRPISRIQVDRPGLEISGFFEYHMKDKLCLIGNKEIALMKTLDDKLIYQNVKKIADPACPGIIFCQGNKVPKPFLKACQENDCPLFMSKQTTSNLLQQIISYLSDKLAATTSMHAQLLQIFGAGVLFIGESGIGKSEVSMELIKKGHRLVADDKVNIKEIRGQLVGEAPALLRGMMEIRGIGIIDITKMFGINSLSYQSVINYAIELVPFEKANKIERFGIKTEYLNILKSKIPIITLPVSAARSMAELIEAAVTNFKLKDQGYDSSFEFEKRMHELQNREDDK